MKISAYDALLVEYPRLDLGKFSVGEDWFIRFLYAEAEDNKAFGLEATEKMKRERLKEQLGQGWQYARNLNILLESNVERLGITDKDHALLASAELIVWAENYKLPGNWGTLVKIENPWIDRFRRLSSDPTLDEWYLEGIYDFDFIQECRANGVDIQLAMTLSRAG